MLYVYYLLYYYICVQKISIELIIKYVAKIKKK